MDTLVQIQVIAENSDFMPQYATLGASGADVKAACKEPIRIGPGESALIPTGLKMEIPSGYEIQVRPRSGLALKNQITVLNSPGTIDSDYRGEVGIILMNHGKRDFFVTPGMRIAQLVVSPVIRAQYSLEEQALSSSARGEGGFGHTGMH